MAERKAKFTVIDAVIILILIAAVGFGAIKVISSAIGVSTEPVELMVQLTIKDKSLVDAINVGDRVTMSLTEKDGGVIKDMRVEPAVQMVFNSIDGIYKNEIIPDKYDIYLTVETEAEISDLVAKTGDIIIQVGAEVPIRGKGYASSGFILERNVK